MKTTPKIYKKDGIKPIWCPGCGDYAVLAALQKAFTELELKPEEILTVSGIGCSGRLSHYLNTYSLHGTHGRAVPTAVGAKAARPDLTVLAVGGDGDGLSIGGGHICHAARKNVDITYIIMDNNIYGLTKGQTSPTTPAGYRSTTAPYGVYDDPMEPLAVFVAYGISFIARTHSLDLEGLTSILTAAIRHKGMSVVYVLSPCVNYRAADWDFLKKDTRPLPVDFPVNDRQAAIEAAWSRVPIYTGIFVREARPVLSERLDAVSETAKARRHGRQLSTPLRELMEDFS